MNPRGLVDTGFGLRGGRGNGTDGDALVLAVPMASARAGRKVGVGALAVADVRARTGHVEATQRGRVGARVKEGERDARAGFSMGRCIG